MGTPLPEEERTFVQRDLDLLIAPIKSRGDLKFYLTSMPERSPLNYLTPIDKEIFISSLQFGENGLSSFNTQPLKNNLDVTKAYEILSLFGQQYIAAQLQGLSIQSATDKEIIAIYGKKSSPDHRNPVKSKNGTSDPPLDGFLEGYRCESRGTCRQSTVHACTSNC